MSTATSTNIAVDMAVDTTYGKHDPSLLIMNLRSQQYHRKDSYLEQLATCKTSLCLKAHLLCETKNNLQMGFCLDCLLLSFVYSVVNNGRYLKIDKNQNAFGKPFNFDILRSLGQEKQIV